MKNPLLKTLLPHGIAILVFLLISVLFCKPVLDGNMLNQHDIIGWKGMAQNSFEHKEKTGHLPLWNTNLFSGMPNYQVTMESKNVLHPVTNFLLFTLPNPINFFFLACVCFYILSLVFGARPIVAMFGAIAYAFVTYNPVILSAGHESKMWAITFMPLVMAGLISIFGKRYWLGLALTAFGTYIQIGVNHFQISYYFFLIAAAVTISYLVIWIKQKDWKHIGMALGITAIAGMVGVAGNALTLLTTNEYTKYTMRGGKDVAINDGKVVAAKTKGLDTSYAFEYSLGKAEATVVLMPEAFGGSSSKTLDEDSKVVDKLVTRGAAETNAIQIASSLPRYWGGIDPSTSGPPYIGIITCLLALIGFVLYKNPLRWGLLAVSVLAILMAWGRYLPGFNTFLFNTLPLYNKFRAPSMAMVITQFTFPLMAVLTLQYVLFRDNSRELLKADFKKILYAAGGLIALLGLIYLTNDYSSPIDKLIQGNKWDNSGTDEVGRLIVSGMKQDRKAMLGGQIFRTLAYTLLVLGILYMYIRNVFKPVIAVILLLAITSIDLFVVGKRYLSDDRYVSKDEMTSTNFTASPIDQEILKDKDPNFRVFYLSGDAFAESRTSYFHKSVGGYHPAKLRIYQDVIEKYLAVQHPGVLNMLNTKYFIAQDPQTGQARYILNDKAFGPCWFVKNVKLVPDRASALLALDSTNLRDTAIVESSLGKSVTEPQWDSASSIRLTKFDNDEIEYEANCSGPQFAVFSEIYYPAGWNAYVDGKKSDYVNTNYILRGLSIPAGKHTVKFIFEPSSYKKGSSISFIASILVLLFFLGGLFMAWREYRKRAGDGK
ncbi:MAG TPA: YfhO family protein [Chitinophagaceae bacterium]|nr:YfhO family protein [Chitinophagaceae bacterium]